LSCRPETVRPDIPALPPIQLDQGDVDLSGDTIDITVPGDDTPSGVRIGGSTPPPPSGGGERGR